MTVKTTQIVVSGNPDCSRMDTDKTCFRFQSMNEVQTINEKTKFLEKTLSLLNALLMSHYKLIVSLSDSHRLTFGYDRTKCFTE